jgi:hypothetical protein
MLLHLRHVGHPWPPKSALIRENLGIDPTRAPGIKFPAPAVNLTPLVEPLRGVFNGGVPVMNIYVGNLSYGMSEDELREAFGAFGEVSSVKILMDRETGRSRGFGFVEMPNQNEAEKAIAQLNGKDVGGRALRINEARPREQQQQQRR